MENSHSDPSRNRANQPSDSHQSFPIADVVSLQSIVNVLIRKGICTPEELYEEEQRRRHEAEAVPAPVVRTTSTRKPDNGYQKRKSSWIKRKMSKHRWSRRLGTMLFGWEWKKVKSNKKERDFDNTHH